MATFPCPKCQNPVLDELDRCPHCGRPALFPNVRDALRQEEVNALQQRYRAAVDAASTAGGSRIVSKLEARLAKSEACKALPRWELERLASADGAVAATYYQQIRGNCRLPDDNRWERLRRIADAAFFRSYSEKVHFAALSTGQRWLEHYGDGALFFRDEMISHRATVFEKNTAVWANEHDASLTIPPGHRAAWNSRTMLVIAKLGPSIASIQEDEIDQRLLCCGTTSASDEFVEVHLYGGFTIRSVRAMIIDTRALSELGRASLLERAQKLALDVTEVAR